jgi:hypothetical protein
MISAFNNASAEYAFDLSFMAPIQPQYKCLFRNLKWKPNQFLPIYFWLLRSNCIPRFYTVITTFFFFFKIPHIGLSLSPIFTIGNFLCILSLLIWLVATPTSFPLLHLIILLPSYFEHHILPYIHIVHKGHHQGATNPIINECFFHLPPRI